MRLNSKPVKGLHLTGQALVSVIVAAGASMVVLAGVATMIQYTVKSGRSAQGISDMGLIADSIRSVVSAKSGLTCPNLFIPKTGQLVFPNIDGTSTVELSTIQIPGSGGGAPITIAEANQSQGSVILTSLVLKRIDAKLAQLQISAEKTGSEVMGSRTIPVPALTLGAKFDASGLMTGCWFGDGLGGGGASPGGMTVIDGDLKVNGTLYVSDIGPAPVDGACLVASPIPLGDGAIQVLKFVSWIRPQELSVCGGEAMAKCEGGKFYYKGLLSCPSAWTEAPQVSNNQALSATCESGKHSMTISPSGLSKWGYSWRCDGSASWAP